MLRARACCFSLALVALLLASQHAAPALAWGAAGHMVIASLAERALHTLPGGEGVARAVAGALGSLEPLLHNASSFAEAAVWLDRLKAQGVRTFSRWHYVDVPVGSPEALERAGEKAVADDDSALWALKQAVGALRSRKVAAFGASFHLRVLLHVGGDLQQPLHSTSRFSDAHPDGDFGGNSVRLSGLPLPFESERGEWLVAPGRGGGENLHGLWDDGVGALTAVPSKYPPPCETCSGVDSEAAARFANLKTRAVGAANPRGGAEAATASGLAGLPIGPQPTGVRQIIVTPRVWEIGLAPAPQGHEHEVPHDSPYYVQAQHALAARNGGAPASAPPPTQQHGAVPQQQPPHTVSTAPPAPSNRGQKPKNAKKGRKAKGAGKANGGGGSAVTAH